MTNKEFSALCERLKYEYHPDDVYKLFTEAVILRVKVDNLERRLECWACDEPITEPVYCNVCKEPYKENIFAKRNVIQFMEGALGIAIMMLKSVAVPVMILGLVGGIAIGVIKLIINC